MTDSVSSLPRREPTQARAFDLARALPVLFGATLLLSALLLFCIEPLVAKMLLPLLGGVPAVWNTCLVFFQGALLLGYVFALGGSLRLKPKGHALVQVAVMLGPLLVLPILIDDRLAGRLAFLGPTLQVLVILAVAAGLPFLALSTVAPTLQRWYSTTRAKGRADPYFLYAASNVGSLLGLLAYPVLLEPHLGLHAQAQLLRGGYVVVIALVALCALATLRLPAESRQQPVFPRASSSTNAAGPASRRRARARWLFLSAVPSAYLVAVTAHLTTDVTPAPFLWMLPLAAYLLSFVFVFAAKPPISHASVVRYYPIAAAFAVYLNATGTTEPLRVMVPAHVLCFFGACLLCHGELVRTRPEPERLNEFYVWMSSGGFVGGIAVALVLPSLLPVSIEYPVCVVLALLSRPLWAGVARHERGAFARHELLLPAGIFVGTALAATALARLHAPPRAIAALVPIVPLLLAFRVRARALCFAACAGALLAGSVFLPAVVLGQVLLRSRNFFGVVQVKRDPERQLTQILHGTTLHGAQSSIPSRRREPLTYYSRPGPVGDVFTVFDALPKLPARVAVIGLGAGTLAAYAHPEQSWTFFEINPTVVRIATDPTLFTFLSDAFPNGRNLRIVLGDARLELRGEAGNYGLLVIDAFSSDAIPVHLVTEEALAAYGSKIAPAGLIAWHVSNRHVYLGPVLAAIAAAKGYTVIGRQDAPPPSANQSDERRASWWAVMSKDSSALAAFPSTWKPIKVRADFQSWTDERSSVLAALHL